MNIINDPWLYATYTDGSSSLVSVRTAFTDAEKIRSIDTPTFHNTRAYIYDLPVVQLLTTVLQASYFKPEHKFKSGRKAFAKELMENGWDNKIISDYLDKWESRFNLFDEKYPFLQDATLEFQAKVSKSKTPKPDYSYIANVSPIAPGMNNTFFGKVRSNCTDEENFIRTYEFDEIELVYILLYISSMGGSPCPAQYPNKSLVSNASLFIIPTGKNLKETIIYNCLPLVDSSRPNEDDEDIKYDRPVWELDSKEEILEYDMESISKNVLLCTFFPGIPLRVIYEDGKIVTVMIARKEEDCIFNNKAMSSLKDAYVETNPWAIKTSFTTKEEEQVFVYRNWNPDMKLISLCIEITSKLPQGNYCRVINPEYQDNHHALCYVYYREFDGKKTNILSYGRYSISQDVFDELQETDKRHEKAVLFSSRLDKITSYAEMCKNEVITAKKYNTQFSALIRKMYQKLELFFLHDFLPNIDNEDILEKSYALIRQEAHDVLVKAFENFNCDFIPATKTVQKFDRMAYALDKKEKKEEE